jgi:hypothetical protein
LTGRWWRGEVLHTCGQAEPLKQEFRRGDDVHGLHRVLAEHVLG